MVSLNFTVNDANPCKRGKRYGNQVRVVRHCARTQWGIRQRRNVDLAIVKCKCHQSIPLFTFKAVNVATNSTN